MANVERFTDKYASQSAGVAAVQRYHLVSAICNLTRHIRLPGI